MQNIRNYVLGHGERLTEPIPAPKSDMTKKHPYTVDEAIERLGKQLSQVVNDIDDLPAQTCPNDESVAIMTLHPAYVAKSYFPEYLLRAFHLRSIGSKPTIITPEKSQKQGKIEPAPTVDLFIAGKRSSFSHFANNISTVKQEGSLSEQIRRFENIRCFKKGERTRIVDLTLSGESLIPLETVLHVNDENYILTGYEKYLNSLDVEIDLNRRFHTRGLCFIPARSPLDSIKEIEKFSFLRVTRQMPNIRMFKPILRETRSKSFFECKLPDETAVDPSLEVFAFDGGIPSSVRNTFNKWMKAKVGKGIGKAIPDYQEHGLGVCSALLFGPIIEGETINRPYSNIVHYRVLDNTIEVETDLYDVLGRIMDVLEEKNPEFFNLSLGPALPIEDDDVHAWTAVLDEYLGEHKCLATVAVGNDGNLDVESGNARIQVPSDCVNCLAIGASDSLKTKFWRRANYSSIGPGRSPGRVKPDAVAFGGSDNEPFYVINHKAPSIPRPVAGTSFASPTVLRLAAGIRAHFGTHLTPLSIKTLLLHCCHKNEDHPKSVGWGMIPYTLSEIMECKSGEVRVVYQGTLKPSKYLRASIPMPAKKIPHMVQLSATFSFNTDTDPQDPSNYTRSGLEIQFRPHIDKHSNKDPLRPKTKTFFNAKSLYADENELRRDAHKWETVLHNSANFRGSSLKEPCTFGNRV